METDPFSTVTYNRFIAEGKLRGSRCRRCAACYTPPRAICPSCHSQDMQWVETIGEGKLAAFTWIFVAPPVLVAQGYGRNRPYCVGVVELADGCRVAARIEGVDPAAPATLRIGMPLQAKVAAQGANDLAAEILIFEPQKKPLTNRF